MENQEPIQDTILLYFNHPEDQILAEQIAHWRGLSEKNEAYFQSAKMIWEASAETKRLEGIDLKRSERNFRLLLDQSITSVQKSRRGYGWIRIAAAILVVVAGTWIYTANTAVNYLVKETKSQLDSVILSDGTKVILAANSAVRYPDRFSGDGRQISLIKGQAFFLVTKDPEHPFEVSIRQSTVKVLGTSFNITYTDTAIEMSVKTGRVAFTPNSKSAAAILTPGEGINYNFSKNKLVLQDGHNANSWITKELQFIDMPLDQVCRQLGDYYGVNIVLNDALRNSKKFNANFKDITLEEALEVLKGTYSIKIEHDGKTIIIKSLL